MRKWTWKRWVKNLWTPANARRRPGRDRRFRPFVTPLEDRLVPASDLMVTIDAAPNFIVDSNLKAGPTAAFIRAAVTNTGTDTISNVTLYIGDFTGAGASGGTPGVFPLETDATYAGNLSLTQVGGATDAVRLVGSLAPGQTSVQYWLVSYPWYDTAGRPTYGAHANNDDDLVLSYDVWAKGADPVDGAVTTAVTRTATMREEISAMANKIWPNTTSKVPNEYLAVFQDQLGWRPDQVAPSVARTEGIWYDFGRVNQGFDADANLVPDYDVWSQPVGDPSGFDPNAWRLVHTYGVLIVKLNDGTEQVIAFEDQLYHKDLPANNTGVVGLVFYEFAPIGTGPGTLSPYQEAASGSNNEKFNGDYGTFVGGPQGTPPSGSIDKIGPATVTPGTTVTYDLVATNTGATSFGLNQYGLPATISDAVPPGTQYVTGSATSDVPATIFFSTDGGVTWTTTDTGAATTNIQWQLSAPLAPGASATTHFSVFVPNGYTGSQVYNTAGFGLAGMRPLYTDAVNSFLLGTNTISGTVFRDDGTGGGVTGDGTRQTNETFLGGIDVTLYPDTNGNGVLDPGELATPRATTVTDAGGNWTFTGLPDGSYIVQVYRADPQRPTGYVLSTDEARAVTLAGANQSGIEFGFAPTLAMTKAIVTPAPILEGTQVTYSIETTNLLKPDNYVASTPLDGRVFFTDTTTSLNYVQPGGGASTTQISGLTAAPTEIAFDETNGKVYLAYASSGLIESRNLDGTGAVTVATGQTSVSGLAVDSVHGYVYWTRLDNDTINRKNSDGTGAVTTLSGLNNPEGVAVDPLNATVYWLETQGNLLRIRKGGLDFSNPTDLFAPTTIGSGNHNPRDLEIDPLRGKLYWADDKSGTNGDFIGVVNLDGTGLQEYITNAATALVNNPQGLGVDPVSGFVYWSDSAGLRKASVLGGPLAATSLGATANLGDVEVPSRFPFVGTFDPDKTFTTVPLTDDYDPTELRFVSATVAPTSVDTVNGLITWNNIGPIDANETRTIYVTFEVLQPPGNATNTAVDNTAAVTGALVANGLPTNDATSQVIVTANPAAVIGDRIWSDKNADGVDAGQATEPGIAGVHVRMFDSTGAFELQRTLTDATGAYRFTGVVAGTYIVRVDTSTLPAGFTETFDADGTGTANQSTVTVSTASNPADNLNQDFGYRITNIFFGSVWQDHDGNGARDAADAGIGGVTVRLRNSTDTADVATATTAPDGTYRFVGVADGSYRVRVDAATLPAGFTWTETAELFPVGTPTDTTLDNLIATGGATAASGGDVRGAYDFGYRRSGTSSIGDAVFYDADGNGLKGFAEGGIPNVTVRLYEDLNATGVLESGFDVFVAATVTDANGGYTFGNLPAGRYIVEVDETDPQFPANVTATGTSPLAVNLPAATAVTTADFGYDPGPGFAATATIGDVVYYDANANGEQDFNEFGIGGAVVRLYSDANNNQQYDAGVDLDYGTVTTSFGGAGSPPAGFYLFSGLASDSDPNLPGNNPYIVQVVSLPANALSTLADQTADPNRDGVPVGDNTFPGLPPGDNQDTGKFIDLNGNTIADPGETGIFVSSGTNYAGADFGYRPRGVVGDYVWLDLNGNGAQDGGEVGLANVAVTITNVPFGGTTTLNTTTDFDGMYFFQGLTAGTWRVTVTPPPGTTPSARVDANLLAGTGTVGANTADVSVDANGDVTAVAVGGTTVNFAAPFGDDGLKIDFGYRLNGPNSLGGRVVLEQRGVTDGNAGEATDAAVAGTTVFLYDSTGKLLGSTLTDATGAYSFTGLPNGTYSVSMAANLPILALTTFTTDDFAPASLPANTTATDNGTAAVLVTTISGSVSNLDFAWVSTVDYDLGDLPDTYATSLSADGARHIISGTPTLYLGSVAPDTEPNASPGAAATGDDTAGTDDEDGVTALSPTAWTEGPGSGTTNSLRVVVNGTGWLVGWIDFNRDGTFLAANELVVNQAVTTGTYDLPITVPAGTFVAGGAVLNSRFRLFTEQPVVPQLAFVGIATDGEVEDTALAVGVPTQADLSLTKTADNNTPRVGQNVVFTVTVTNDGPSGATGVTVTDLLPSGLQYVSDNGGGAYDPATGIWTVGSIASTGAATIQITATVLAAGSYTNAAQVQTADQLDPDSTPGDNSTAQDDDDRVTLVPVPVADLTLAKTADNNTPRVGQNVVFTVTVHNDGPSGATGVTVTDLLPSGLQYVSDDLGGAYDPATGVWSIGTLASGADAVLRVTARVLATGSYTNAAQVQTADQLDPDSTPGDNSTAQDDDDSVTLAPVPVADLSLTKTADNNTPFVGDNVVFTVTVTNDGPSGATGVTVTDLLPSGLQYVSDNGGGAYDPATGIWTVGSIASTGAATIQITATVLPTGGHTNAAQVQASNTLDPDSTPGDNSTAQDDDDSVTLAPVLRTTASLSGLVFNDLDGDGARGPNEPGIAGVTVTLTGTDVANGSVSRTAVTGADGTYTFSALPPGTYTVSETQPAAYADGGDRAGTAGGTVSNDRVSGVALVAGQTATGYTFAERAPNSVTGFVYRDFDLNGVRTVGGPNPESGIGGIVITLTGTDALSNPVSLVTQTDAAGVYRFDNLLAGTYTLTETQPPLPTTLDDGFYDGADNVGTPAGSSPAKNQLRVTLGGSASAPADAATGYNFGELPAADPFGYVYLDANSNGVRDPGEPGVANVAITLSGTAFFGTQFARPLTAADVPGGRLTVRTNADGFYEFRPVPPGLYSLTETQPDEYADGPEQNGDASVNPAFPVLVGNDVFSNVYLAPQPVRGPFNFGERLVPIVQLPPAATGLLMPVGAVNKSWYLSSTGVPHLPALSTAPTFANSVAALGRTPSTPTRYVAVGADAGQPAVVRVFDFNTGAERFRLDPYAGYQGGVRVAVGDVNGDGFEDIITAPGFGVGPHVKVFDGRTGAVLASFMAYAQGYLGGVSVAAGDVDGDGRAEVVTGSGPGVAPHVKLFNGSGAERLSFLAYAPGYLGSFSVGAGDMTGDGRAEIITGAGPAAGPHVKSFDGSTGAELSSFMLFVPGFVGGVSVTAGDLNGDGFDELIVGAASGSGAQVVVRDGRTRTVIDSAPAWSDFPGSRVRVGSADINRDGFDDLIVGSGPGSGRVTIRDGRTRTVIEDFFGVDPFGAGGVFVG
ncbi:MAG: SdrD B-like domain-containing protein [Gemmata sp.]